MREHAVRCTCSNRNARDDTARLRACKFWHGLVKAHAEGGFFAAVVTRFGGHARLCSKKLGGEHADNGGCWFFEVYTACMERGGRWCVSSASEVMDREVCMAVLRSSNCGIEQKCMTEVCCWYTCGEEDATVWTGS